MATLIASVFAPDPAPGDDLAFRRAKACGFVVSRSMHAAYFDWCITMGRPYVGIETGWGKKVVLVMQTCSWRLATAQRRYLTELAKKRTGNASDFHYTEDSGTFTFYGVPEDRAATIAWRAWEAALDSRPPGRGEDVECSGA